LISACREKMGWMCFPTFATRAIQFQCSSSRRATGLTIACAALTAGPTITCSSLSEAKHIDIGVEGIEDVQVWVGELDMTALVRNLVDNAIRYKPEGGRIDLSVSVANGETVLRVDDTGPGIQIAERDRVFAPFYRTLGNEQSGSGLGRSIVQAIAMRIGAKIQLGFSDALKQTGLRVNVILRVAAPSGRHDRHLTEL
jgi:two-component system OmpR family sensor kinase